MVNLLRDSGSNTKKIFVNQNFFYPTIFKDGTFVNFGAHINGGLYHVSNYDNPKSGERDYNKFNSTFYPQMTICLLYTSDAADE